MRADILYCGQNWRGRRCVEKEGENDVHSEEVLGPFIPDDVGDD